MHDAVGQYLRHTSWPIITAMVALMIFGITAIDVSEKAEATLSGDTAQQMVFGGVGLAAFVVMSVVPYRKIGQLAYPLFALTLISLVVVVLPILFPSVFGGGWIKSLLPPIRQAHRWIRLGGMQFQPSEVAKLTFIILLAWYLRSGDHYRRLGGLAIPFVLTLVPMTLILIEPDLGTSLLLLPTLYVMLFMAGAKLRHLVGIVAVGTVLVLLPMPLRLDPQAKWGELAGRRALAYSQFEAGGHEYVLCAAPLAIMEYRQLERIEAWWRQEDSEDERIVRDIGFQLQMSKMILGSGRWTGRGDWNRSETYFRILPDDHNDFIFAVIGGQWGLVGCVILLGLYA
ncbi:MAG: FtsW/RodA/SpoVE family cell cycle protein, partial [Phycisphaerae bacterium]|nr:FtsW/RodA/SpoVE family cell cycle protein [Phycisphaerae bacterium]